MLGLLGGLLGGIGSIFGGNSVSKAAKKNSAMLDQLQTQGQGYIDTANNQATGYLGDVGNLFKGLSDQSGGLSGMGLYGDALGVNGADGTARARDAFQSSPGYEFQLDQGLDALERRAGAQGRLSSGQTGLDTLGFAQGLANQDYNNWLSNLSGYGQQQAGLYTTGLQGQAGALSDLANLATGTGDRRLNLISEVANGKMASNNQKAQGTNQAIQGGLQGLGSIFGSYL